jgi:aminopeptidase N
MLKLKPFSGIVIILSFVLFFFCSRTRTYYQEGVSLELARYRAKQIYDVHYVLEFQIPDQKDASVSGKVEVHFKPLKARHGVILDFQPGEDYIHNLTVNGIKSIYNVMNGHIYIDANGLVPRQNNKIEIEFTSSNQALNRSDEFMYTLFVPDRASTAFPCFDQPDIKATFDLTLAIPPNWNALSNGPITYDEVFDDLRVIRFASGKPLSTYLFAFTTGVFEVLSETRNDKTMHIYHRETDEEKINRNATVIFNQHFEALEWLENYTGIPYPYDKFDLAILPGFQYSGMEHPGAIWYRDTRLLLDTDASITRQISQASLIAHETAHMWFGNLVTMQWFDDVWLKEVFAGFMADKIINEFFPDVNHRLSFILSHYPRAWSVDRTMGTHPIKQQLDNMKMAGTLYGPIIYNKAPIVFEQLELIMGEEDFKAAVREYLMTYTHGNADWNDLALIFDAHSSHNISAWSKAWIYGKGLPGIGYTLAKNGQSEFITVETDGDYHRKEFPAQLLSSVMVKNDKPAEQTIWLDKSQVIARLVNNFNKPDAVILNGAGTGYGFFKMNEQDINYALSHAWALESEILRAILYLNINENFLNHFIGKDDYFEFLMDALLMEKDEQLQNYLVSNLMVLCNNFLEYGKDQTYSKRVESLLWNKFSEVPVTSKELFFETWLKLSRSNESIQLMKDIYEGRMKVGNYQFSEQNLTDLVCELVIRDPASKVLLEKELERLKSPDRQRRLIFIKPTLSDDKSQRDSFFEGLLKPENRNPEPWVLEALYYLHHPLHKGQGIDYIPTSLELLPELQQTGDIFFPQNWLRATLQNYNSPVVADMVMDYLSGNPELSENLRLKVYQSADILFRSKVANSD